MKTNEDLIAIVKAKKFPKYVSKSGDKSFLRCVKSFASLARALIDAMGGPSAKRTQKMHFEELKLLGELVAERIKAKARLKANKKRSSRKRRARALFELESMAAVMC